MGDPREFYDQLASDYHLLFQDWDRAVERQAGILDTLIGDLFSPKPSTVLDCSCGIGTQAIGLALRGYRVHATDLSACEVTRTEAEARRLGATLTTGVADFRELPERVPGAFDLVISCDNSLPHLLTDEDLRLAARSIFSKVRPGGHFLASQRDYDSILNECPSSTAPGIFNNGMDRRVSFQLWDWEEDHSTYRFEQLLLQRKGQAWAVKTWSGRYRALKRGQLTEALASAGFENVQWHFPERTGYYQPIVTASKPDGEGMK